METAQISRKLAPVTSLLACVAVSACIGSVLGVLIAAVWFTRPGNMPNVAMGPQHAEVVLVVQTATPSAGAAAQPPPAAISNVTTAQTTNGARAYLRAGSQDAKVHVVMFADGQCPYCKQMSSGPIRQLIAEYASTGTVAVTYRHYATLGQESQRLAVAMECAGKQGKFWPYHDQAFNNPLPENTGAVTNDGLAKWAKEVKLDLSAFQKCLGESQIQELIEADFRTGQTLRVHGTPTLFVNGERLVGAVPYEILKSKVDEALNDTK